LCARALPLLTIKQYHSMQHGEAGAEMKRAAKYMEDKSVAEGGRGLTSGA
jgi:hypothetical protein